MWPHLSPERGLPDSFDPGKVSPSTRPAGAEKLSGQERYRIRQGNYRILYSIQDGELTIWVVKVGHRREVYRPG